MRVRVSLSVSGIDLVEDLTDSPPVTVAAAAQVACMNVMRRCISSVSRSPCVPLMARVPPHSLVSSTRPCMISSLPASAAATSRLEQTNALMRRDISTGTPNTPQADPSSGSVDAVLSSLDRRLHSLETQLDGSSARSHAMLQELAADIMRVRTGLEEADKNARSSATELKKLSASQYLTSGLFLVYLFVALTWTMMLITDLSAHMHGMPGQQHIKAGRTRIHG